jgi:hypothetical protein
VAVAGHHTWRASSSGLGARQPGSAPAPRAAWRARACAHEPQVLAVPKFSPSALARSGVPLLRQGATSSRGGGP